MKFFKYIALSLFAMLSFTANLEAQENDPILPLKVAPQNLLKFNRFLINPTFTTVREDNSYINFLHRNQSFKFDNNDQTYFVSYSGRIGDRNGLGLSLYSQQKGLVSNIGIMANYAYGVKLSDKSNFTFGANLAYYNTGFDRNRSNELDPDNFLNSAVDSNILSFQPGFNLSLGNFDFGAYAENLFDYNIKSGSQLTDFADKTYSGHLQYTHRFENGSGLLENARIMPIGRVRLNAQDSPLVTTESTEDLSYGGGLILDLPKLGWLQGGYDSFYGASAGAGFNLNKRLSLGYTMEKGFGTDIGNLGTTHEISFAYSFTPNLTEDRVMLENDPEDALVENEELDPTSLASNDELEELKRRLEENDAVLAELMFRQDSLENSREKDLERRFSMVMRMVKNETNGERPDLEKRAEVLFNTGQDQAAEVAANTGNYNTIPNSTNTILEETEIVAETTLGTEVAEANPTSETNTITATQERDAAATTTVTPTSPNENVAYENDAVAQTDPIQERTDTKVYEQESTNTYTQERDAVATTTVTTTSPNENASYENNAVAATTDYAERNTSTGQTASVQDNTRSAAYTQTPQKDRLKSRKFRNLDGVENGYYVVANVYKGGKYMENFINTLNDQGIAADYIDNPHNGLKYVYLERYNSWEDAKAAYESNLGGSFDGPMWVMNVDNRYTNEAYASNVNKIQKKAERYNTEELERNTVAQDKIATKKAGKTFRLDGVNSGFYIIANVFANPNNAKRFVKTLNSYGLSASYFINPENNWRYVYLKRHQSWNNALISYYSKINDSYDDKMWIMRVNPDLVA